jgi:hypothetical protein
MSLKPSTTIVAPAFRSRLCGLISITWKVAVCLPWTMSASHWTRCGSWYRTSTSMTSTTLSWLTRQSVILVSQLSTSPDPSNSHRQWCLQPRRRPRHLPIPRRRKVRTLPRYDPHQAIYPNTDNPRRRLARCDRLPRLVQPRHPKLLEQRIQPIFQQKSWRRHRRSLDRHERSCQFLPIPLR